MPAAPPPHLLICTDLDRTLLPNGRQPESAAARPLFARFTSQQGVTLAYASGRHRTLVEEAIATYELPAPDWVIGDVGTTLYRVQAGRWDPWPSWEEEIAGDWQGLWSEDLQPLFLDLEPLTLQEPAKQNRYKLSYTLPLTTRREELLECMSLRLQQKGLAVSLIYSVDEPAGLGLLDVLPARATKLHALEFLMRQQGFEPGNTLFAGDSGNDLPVLCSAVPSVLVANADAATITQAQQQSDRQGTADRFYLARGGFLGMNGNYAAGILEGIAHFHPQAHTVMEAALRALPGHDHG
jgi:sucrose-6F-phosphate phosphohydrolase